SQQLRDDVPGASRSTKVTIAQLAEQSGLSIATVSKVLNGRPDVSAATRSRVEHLIASSGYRRRGSPVTAAPPLIDVVFEEFESPWAVEIVRGAVSAAQEEGLTVALTSLSEGDERRVWFDQITSRGTRGVILLLSRLTPRQYDELRARRLPFVVIDPRGEPGREVSSVGATNWAGGLAATRHLLELGHRRVAMITGPADLLCSRARLDGYRAGLETAGLRVDSELVRWGDFHVGGGYEHGRALLRLANRPTAIFAGSDLQALGVLEAAREAGLRVPDELSLVGFDDLPLSRWASPSLTTVRQPLVEMAALAVRIVLESSLTSEPDIRRVELATDLVVRESTTEHRARRGT
ncbi:MAG TPA: LacI family DNA-binding transcriptional regulator, partial [Acidimicrobiales bacterium]|nr:LacI family DNA-binding transcriptional regulator [Acidimicrobiales bacterium]